MNANMVANDREYWCGKEVQIFKDGKQIVLPEGPFVLYDGCAACTSASIIDLSAEAFTLVSGGTCGNNPEGITVKVIDNDLSASLGDAARGSAQGSSPYNPTGADSASSAAPSSAAAEPSAAPVAEASSAKIAVGNLAADAASSAAEQPSSSVEAVETPAVETPAETPAAETPAAETPAAEPSAPAAETPVAEAPAAETPAADSAACTYGKWQCAGLELQVCNMKTQDTTEWETIATCASECSFSITGSAICQ